MNNRVFKTIQDVYKKHECLQRSILDDYIISSLSQKMQWKESHYKYSLANNIFIIVYIICMVKLGLVRSLKCNIGHMCKIVPLGIFEINLKPFKELNSCVIIVIGAFQNFYNTCYMCYTHREHKMVQNLHTFIGPWRAIFQNREFSLLNLHLISRLLSCWYLWENIFQVVHQFLLFRSKRLYI